MMDAATGFWADLQERVKTDPEFAQEYLLNWVRVTTVDRLISALDARRVELDMSKAELARAIRKRPEVVRRLMADASSNPTIDTVSSAAAAMGFKLELVPMDESEQAEVAEQLREFAAVG